MTNYGLVSGKCTQCTAKDANLMNCDNDVSVVSSCKKGYYLKDKACVKCIDNCDKCADDKTCTADMCMDGYTVNKDMTKCLKCATGCRKCATTCIKGCLECFATTTGSECKCSDKEEWSEKDMKCITKKEVDTTAKKVDPAPAAASTSGSLLKFTQFFLICLVLSLSYMI